MPRFEKRKNGLRPFEKLVWPAGMVLVLSAALLISACSSDEPNAVGVGLVDTEIDSLLVTLDLKEISTYRGIPISDPDIPLWDQEVLYLGEKDGNASSILFQYDFDAVLNDTITLDLFTGENISSVNFRMLMLMAFSIPDTSKEDPLLISPWKTFYELYHLDAPIDSTAYPGEDPSTSLLSNLNGNWDVLEEATTVNMPLPSPFGDLVNWMSTGGIHAFLIKEGPNSGEGLVGYSSMDMLHGGSTLDATTILPENVGPVIVVELKEPQMTLIIPPVLDISTFNSVGPVPADPADGFIMRTGLRSYPALFFDFSSLPEDIFINRAVLAVANDTTTSWGTLESIVVSEMDPELFGAEGDTLALDDLGAAVYPITGMISLDPTVNRLLEFNVTTAVQRMINGVYEGTRGFILTPGEDFLPSYDTTTLDPDFYFNQFNFFGTADPDTLFRPRLKITYTVNEIIQGGGK